MRLLNDDRATPLVVDQVCRAVDARSGSRSSPQNPEQQADPAPAPANAARPSKAHRERHQWRHHGIVADQELAAHLAVRAPTPDHRRRPCRALPAALVPHSAQTGHQHLPASASPIPVCRTTIRGTSRPSCCEAVIARSARIAPACADQGRWHFAAPAPATASNCSDIRSRRSSSPARTVGGGDFGVRAQRDRPRSCPGSSSDTADAASTPPLQHQPRGATDEHPHRRAARTGS